MNIRNQYGRFVPAVLQMLAGTALTAAAFGMIISPLGYAAGGVTGLSRVLCRLLPVPLSATVLAVNLLLLAVGWIFVGRRFVVKTVAVSLLFPALLELFSRFPLTSLGEDKLLSALMAGAMLGLGTGLVIRSGASCGGFDTLGVVLNKRFRVSVSTVMRCCDCAVILLQALRQPLLETVYGILVILISAGLVGYVAALGSGESQVMIFSRQYAQIRQALLYELDAGVTLLEAESGYEGEKMKVILSVVPFRKLAAMKQMITKIDPMAFVVVDQIQSVLGKGYTMERINTPREVH